MNQNRFLIETANGYKDFDTIKKVKSNENFKFILENNTEIQVTGSHKFIIDVESMTKITARELKVNDYLLYKDKVTKIRIKEIIPILTKDNYYDIINVQDGHHYVAMNLIQSNCAYIANNDINDFEDSVLPTVESVPNSQIIKSSTAKGRNHWFFEVDAALKKDNIYQEGELIKEIGKLVEDAYAEDYKDDLYIENITKVNDEYIVRKNIGQSGYRIVEANYLDKFINDPEGAEEFKQKQIAAKSLVFFQQAHANEFAGSSYTLIDDKKLATIQCAKDDDIIFNSLFEGLRIFEEPVPCHHYILTMDPKKDGIDAVGMHVIDVTNLPFKQVATAQIMESYLIVPGRLFDLGNYYNKALVVCENNIAESIPSTLYYNYEYEGEVFVERSKKGKKKTEMGFRTTVKTKKMGLTMLKKFIEEDNLILRDKETLNELFNFIQKSNGTYSAEEGYHDDLVMSLMLTFAPFMDIKNWDNFKGFITYLEKNKKQEEEQEQDAAEFLDLGFGPGNEEVDLPFTKEVWDNESFNSDFTHYPKDGLSF